MEFKSRIKKFISKIKSRRNGTAVFVGDILKAIKNDKSLQKQSSGLCRAITEVCSSYGVQSIRLIVYKNIEIIRKKFIEGDRIGLYFWPPYDWSEEGGRMQFLDWLIEKYPNNFRNQLK